MNLAPLIIQTKKRIGVMLKKLLMSIKQRAAEAIAQRPRKTSDQGIPGDAAGRAVAPELDPIKLPLVAAPFSIPAPWEGPVGELPAGSETRLASGGRYPER
jgi:hypothetical protein